MLVGVSFLWELVYKNNLSTPKGAEMAAINRNVSVGITVRTFAERSTLLLLSTGKIILGPYYVIMHDDMKAYGGVEVRDGNEWSASRPVRFTPGERAPCTLWIGGCAGRRAGLNAVDKGKVIPVEAVEALWVVRRRGSHIF
jgi:hypothetical protein